MFQHRIYSQSRSVPEELNEIIDGATYEKARLYGLDKSKFSMVKESYNLVLTTVSMTLVHLKNVIIPTDRLYILPMDLHFVYK